MAKPDATGLTPLQNAAENNAIVDHLYSQLHDLGEARKRHLKAEKVAVEFRAQLQKAAIVAFGHRADRAQLFLSASHNKLGSQSPLTYCCDAHTLRTCLALLPRRR